LHIAFSSLDDNALLSLILQGNEEALGELYDRRAPIVFSIALHVTRDWFSAEEVTQDVFHVVWVHSSRYQSVRGSVTDWLVGITRHRSIDKIRSCSHKALLRDQGTSELLVELPDTTLNVEEHVISQDTIRTALEALPLVQRQVIELVCCIGLSYMEASAVLNIPFGTLKTRLRLGRAKLCEWFESSQKHTA
jgi:RNA polymerase sigma-70 factor (ECF subfamily)